LTAATRNAGVFAQEQLRAELPFGTIETGRRADLVLMTANPLQDIANSKKIVGVMVQGRWLDRRELDRLRATPIAIQN